MLADAKYNRSERHHAKDTLKIACVAGFGLALTAAVFLFWYHREYNLLRERFRSISTQITQVMPQGMRMHAAITETVRSFYDASEFVSRDEFALATGSFLDQYEDVRALAWAPLIDRTGRSGYETQVRSEGVEGFQFSQIDGTGKLVKRVRQREYIPIAYLEPYAGNESLMGFDLASDARCLSTMQACRDSGKTAILYLPQFGNHGTQGQQFGIVVPVYRREQIPYTIAGRRKSLQGFVLGVFHADVMLDSSLKPLLPQGLGVSFTDVTDENNHLPIHAVVAGQHRVAAATGETESPTLAFIHDEAIRLLGRKWQVRCWATTAFASDNRAWSTWVILPVGLLLTAMATALTTIQLSRTRHVEREVAIRTAELDRIHRELVQVSRRAGMSEIATGVLHNVGNVLNSVNVTTNLMAERVQKSRITELERAGDLLSEHVDDMAAFVSEHPQGRHMARYFIEISKHLASSRESMLDELDNLHKDIEHIKEIVKMQQSYAKVSGVMEELDLRELIEDALRIKSVSFGRHHIDIVRNYSNLPRVLTDRHKIMQIVVNLVDNAKQAVADYRPDGGTVRLSLFSNGNYMTLEVSDNGSGIAKENLSRVFNYGFTTKSDGHGFGLHASALAAKEMSGTLTVCSDGVGTGATFSLKLPIAPQATAPAHRDIERDEKLEIHVEESPSLVFGEVEQDIRRT